MPVEDQQSEIALLSEPLRKSLHPVEAKNEAVHMEKAVSACVSPREELAANSALSNPSKQLNELAIRDSIEISAINDQSPRI